MCKSQIATGVFRDIMLWCALEVKPDLVSRHRIGKWKDKKAIRNRQYERKERGGGRK